MMVGFESSPTLDRPCINQRRDSRFAPRATSRQSRITSLSLTATARKLPPVLRDPSSKKQRSSSDRYPLTQPALPSASLQQRNQVLLELRRFEIGLADRAMNDTPLVRAIAHLTGFRVLHRAHDIRRHGADLVVRHQSTRAEDLAQLTHDAHGVGARDDDVEIELAGLHLLGEILEAHDIGARFARRILILARRKDRNA